MAVKCAMVKHRLSLSSNKIVSKWGCGKFQFVNVYKPLIENAQQKHTQNCHDEAGL